MFDKDGHVRKNIHTLHMETQQKILSYAKQQINKIFIFSIDFFRLLLTSLIISCCLF